MYRYPHHKDVENTQIRHPNHAEILAKKAKQIQRTLFHLGPVADLEGYYDDKPVKELRKIHVRFVGNKGEPLDTARVAQQYREGVAIGVLCEDHHVGPKRIYKALAAEGVKLRSKTARWKCGGYKNTPLAQVGQGIRMDRAE